MRIGLITGEYPPMEGGVGAFTRELAVAMAKQGHTIHLCTHPSAVNSGEPGLRVTCLIRNWNAFSITLIRKWS
ncbi:MAG TPA: hypothetical protein VMT34_05200, partial [Aggregatilineales bacterium]|nr:hypothetical protein [Aggregatilineales bacterium]